MSAVKQSADSSTNIQRRKTICSLPLPQRPSVYVCVCVCVCVCLCVCVCVCVFEALQKNLFNVRNRVNKETNELVTSLLL